ncbi:MAG: M56 family metallopeptidase, partial [Gemmatimonadota bacterium]
MNAVNALAAWLLTYAVHSTLLLGIAYVLLRRTRPAATRDFFWKLTAFGAVLTASMQSVIARSDRVEPLAGRWEIPSVSVSAVVPSSPSPILIDEAGTPAGSSSERIREPSSVQSESSPITDGHAPSSTTHKAPSPSRFRLPELSWQPLLVMMWALGMSLALFFLGRRYARARRRFARRYDAVDPDLMAAVHALSTRIGLGRRVRVTRCSAVRSPVALGRSEICLPEALLRVLPAEQRTSMLAHELAHLERNDPLWLAAFSWLEAVLFFQPLNRIARKGFQQAAEHLCDQHALVHTDSPMALAQCLAEVARWLHGESEPLPYPTMGESASPLIDRVQRVLSGVREPVSTTVRARWSAYSGMFAFAVMAPVVTDRPALPALSSSVIERSLESIATDAMTTAQETDAIAHAVRRTASGVVRFSYPSRPSICGTGEEKDGTRMFALQPDGDWLPAGRTDVLTLYVWDRGELMRNDLGGDGTWTTPCNPGPARVDLTVVNGKVVALDLSVADPAPRLSGPVTDLQVVSATDAAQYLLTLAPQAANHVGERALLAVMMARGSSSMAGRLLPLLEDSTLPERIRQSAQGWLNTVAQPQQQELDRLADLSLPLTTRIEILRRQRSEEVLTALVSWRYDRVPDRAMRVELIDWLSQRENKLVRDKLMTIVRDAVVWEEQQAALRALERSSDADARAFAVRYRNKQVPTRDEMLVLFAAGAGDAAAQQGAQTQGVTLVNADNPPLW